MTPAQRFLFASALAFLGFLLWQVTYWRVWWAHRDIDDRVLREGLIWRQLLQSPDSRRQLVLAVAFAALGLLGLVLTRM